MKRIKMAYMLGMLLVQSACIMSMNFENVDDAIRDEVRAAIQNGNYVLSPDERYLVIHLNDGNSVVVDLNRRLGRANDRANENLPAGPAQEEAKEADEKEQANAEEEDVIETDTDHPSQR